MAQENPISRQVQLLPGTFHARADENGWRLVEARSRAEPGIDDARIQMVQPIHFIAEVAAVLAREKPRQAHDDLLDLIDIECRIIDTPDIHSTAADLAIRYRHHLFDTLYHAVALHTPGATLVTADRLYYEKSKAEGQIDLLAAWDQETP